MAEGEKPGRDDAVDEPPLASLAAAILDGAPVDWDGITASASGDDQQLFAELRLLEEIGKVHRSPNVDAPLPVDTDVPATWAHLQILELVGRGTFGRVFRAWDPRLEREVALKILASEESSHTSLASPVIEEARLLARIRHPNVVTVYGAERVGAQVGLWMEYVHGHTLEQMMEERGIFSATEAAAVGIDLCAALAAMHAAGLMHRDLKAQNVMREAGGRVVVVDFGAGRHLGNTAFDTEVVTGTPVYLAPELFAGAAPTAQTEIYSLGVLLFHLATGSFPVRGRTTAQLRNAHREGKRSLLRDMHPTLDEGFVEIVERAIDPVPARRFASASALAEALRSWHQQTHLAPPSTADPTAKLRRSVNRRAYRFGAAAVAVSGAAAIAFVVWSRTESGPTAPRVTDVRTTMATPTARRLSIPGFALLGRPDAQGREISYTDFDGDLAIADLATGEGRKITNHGDSEESAEFSAMSPDGREVAYSWWTLDDAYELRVVDAEGRRPRIILPRDATEAPIPLEWSRDGKHVLSLLVQRDGSVNAALVPAAGGAVRIIRRFQNHMPDTISLSEDGRYIAFDLPSSNTSAHDVYTVALETGAAQLVVSGAADDRSPMWTPDGRGLLFLSDRAGTVDGWFVPVTNGASSGDPRLIMRNMARATPVGFTDRGTYLYELHTGMPDVQIVDLAPSSYAVVGQPRAASALVGSSIGPAWSRDGRFFSYITTRPTQPLIRGGRAISIQAANGSSRVIEPTLGMLEVSSPRFSPDGRTLLIRGRDLRGRFGYFTVDAISGRTDAALYVDRPRNLSDYGKFDWSPDERALLYIHFPTGLRSRRLGSGGDELFLSHAAAGFQIGGFAVAPDGRSIALLGSRAVGTERRAVIAVSSDGGPPREVLQSSPPETIVLQSWTPDSRRLIYTTFTPGRGTPHSVWHVDIDGRDARPLGLSIDGFTQINTLAIRPDGRQLAFTQGGAIEYELWAIDHFLP